MPRRLSPTSITLRMLTHFARGARSVASLLAMCALALTSACGGTASNKATARRVLDDILNRQRYDLFDSLYGPGFVKHVNLRSYDLAQEIEAAKGMHALSSDLVLTVDLMVAEGDIVAILYTGEGTSTGPFMGLPPTGRRVKATGTTLFRFERGKIVEEWTTYDALEQLQQMGYTRCLRRPWRRLDSARLPGAT